MVEGKPRREVPALGTVNQLNRFLWFGFGDQIFILAPLSPQIRIFTVGHRDQTLAEFVRRGGANVDPVNFYIVP